MSAVGATIMGVFGAIWWVAGATASGHGSVPMYAIPLLVTCSILVAAWWRRGPTLSVTPEESARRGRLVGIASGVEGLLILVAVNVLANIGKLDFMAPVVAIIVGLHFLPLARGLPARLYYATSALLIAIGLVGFSVSDAASRLFTVSLSAACVLWLTSAVVLRGAEANR